VLDGFAGYKLMANNNDEHFQWTSNVAAAALAFGDSGCRPVAGDRRSRAGGRRLLASPFAGGSTQRAASWARGAGAADRGGGVTVVAPSPGVTTKPWVRGLRHSRRPGRCGPSRTACRGAPLEWGHGQASPAVHPGLPHQKPPQRGGWCLHEPILRCPSGCRQPSLPLGPPVPGRAPGRAPTVGVGGGREELPRNRGRSGAGGRGL
jgi:hypothetical protein